MDEQSTKHSTGAEGTLVPAGGVGLVTGEGRAALHHVGAAVASTLALTADELARIAPPTGLPIWTSNLRVGELAVDSVALASLAMTLVAEDRKATGGRDHRVRVDASRVQASFGSHLVLRIDGEPPAVWAPLSGFWQASDGWVRTHGNYPHHARRILILLGLPDDAEKFAVADAIRAWPALELEEQAARSGALALAVRDIEEWHRHPQFAHIGSAPVLGFATHAGAEPRSWKNEGPRPWKRGRPQPWRTTGSLPLSGVRVLDLTRVIAGPVATRDLALAGAEVLRIDSPDLPEPEWQHFDTGQGKSTTLLDLRDRGNREVFERLLEDADVVVHGYRPSTLAAFGLDPEELLERHPGLVVAQLSAWGTEGPWGRRRGFDSLVQAACGIAVAESDDGGQTPGALPVQALDHSSGHFLAAAIATALRRQRAHGGSFAVSISLARIGHELLAAGSAVAWSGPDHPNEPGQPTALPSTVVPVATTAGTTVSVECAPPVLDFPGAPTDYPTPLHPWGSDPAAWSDDGLD